MNDKSTAILGHRVNRTVFLTDEEKLFVINKYLNSNETKQAISMRYLGQNNHGQILRWMRQFGIVDKCDKTPIFADMKKNKPTLSAKSEDLSVDGLKKRIKELEKQVHISETKAFAYSKMIDIAEKELKINIRKKSNTKPSKK